MHKIIAGKARGVLGFIGALVLMCVLASSACAEIIDDIVSRTDANGEVDAVIKFTVNIQNLRYAQQKQPGNFLAVYFNILNTVANNQWQDFEMHRSPPSDAVPGFSVTTRDMNVNPKIEIQFESSVNFSLKAGRDGRSLVIHIKPDTVKQNKDNVTPPAGLVEPAVATALTPAPSLPVAAPAAVPTPVPAIPPAALVKPVPQPTGAELIDDISMNAGVNGEVDAVIKFATVIQRPRYAPQNKTASSLQILFDISDKVAGQPWRETESHQYPAADNLPGFTVTAHDTNQSPKFEIKFDRATDFVLKAGKDGRSLVFHIKPDLTKQTAQSKPSVVAPLAAVAAPVAHAAAGVTALAAAVTPVVTAPAVAAPAAVTAGAQVAPAPAAATKVEPVVAPQLPVAPVVTQPVAAPVVASPAVEVTPEVAEPVVVLQPVPIPSATAQLGGKDGLPAFPVIVETMGLPMDAKPVGGLPLADQIKRADSQAALQMALGREAVLKGDMSFAINAFNNVLKLSANKYSQDAQVWVAIAREKSGQPYKALSEYETYLKLYPSGSSVAWVKDRRNKLAAVLPVLPSQETISQNSAKAQRTDFQNMEYGSLSMYYYTGASHTNTITTVGTVQTPTTLTQTDQSTLLSNVMMTDRFYNNEFDNRVVFQGFSAKNFLAQQGSTEQLNALYVDVRNRIDDYSVRVGRQSPYGGGVMGRFDGATAGYGVTQNTHVNMVAGQLSDTTIGPKPVFFGASVDLGAKEAFGGTVYAIKQTISGITDRQAVGGTMRYFDHGNTAMSMLDYDTLLKDLNWATLMGTLHEDEGLDYNFMLDHRKSPTLDIRNAVIGTATSINTLLQNGFTQSDLLTLAKQRTATSNMAMLGVNKRIAEKWQAGSDLSVSNTSGMPQSGTLINGAVNPLTGAPIAGSGTPGLEGFLPATPPTGVAWTLSGRLMANDLISNHDISMASLSYTKSQQMTGEMFLLTNHTPIQEKLTLDSTLRLYLQTDNFGGKQDVVAPVLKLGYQVRNTLTLETEAGVELTKSTPSTLQSSTTNRRYFSGGFRWNF